MSYLKGLFDEVYFKDIDNLLEYISNNPKEIFEKKKICMNVAKENTWIKRAMQVAKDLIGE